MLCVKPLQSEVNVLSHITQPVLSNAEAWQPCKGGHPKEVGSEWGLGSYSRERWTWGAGGPEIRTGPQSSGCALGTKVGYDWTGEVG